MTDVSFIVPAYNEELLLADTVEAIRRAASSLPDTSEITVVDDARRTRNARPEAVIQAAGVDCGRQMRGLSLK